MSRYKRLSVLALTLALCLSLLGTSVLAAFSDVSEEDWFAEAAEYVESHGLFKGTDQGIFSPDETMTRGMFVTAVCRMDRSQNGSFPDSGFLDVSSDSYYATAVNWAKSIDIIQGTSETEFSPEEPITREQLCTLMCRYAEYLTYSLPQTVAPAAFTDQADISEYALASVEAAQQAGLVDGYPNGSFLPQATATRSEVAAIILRLGRLLEANGRQVGPGTVDLSDWRLMLVNRWNPIPEGYVDTIPLKTTPTGYEVDARIYDDYMAMISAMRNDGLSPYLNSAFRTNDYQQMLYTNKVNQYISYGYSRSQAQELAAQWVAPPGTSEHELGLAVDISMNTSDSDAIHAWLQKNAYKYGFILRYTADKLSITGVNAEPWHYRYVGKEYAEMIRNSGLCLEEFLAQYQ